MGPWLVAGGWMDERARNGGVDEVRVPGPGRLWLCGKHFVGPDPEAALARTGASSIVCLNEVAELAGRYPDYVRWLEANGPVRATWFPVPDLHAPAAAAVAPMLDELVERLAAGEGVLVHCGAGVGRAGTIAAAVLMRLGLSRADALATVAASRPTAGPQADVQDALLAALDDDPARQ
jgi:protein-tyrosine phosphatase